MVGVAIISPGAWDVRGGVGENLLRNAIRNMRALRRDAKLESWARRPKLDSYGRYGFSVVDRHGRDRDVLMPGLVLARVRSKDLLAIPRLYVDGSSWFWWFAVDVLRDRGE